MFDLKLISEERGFIKKTFLVKSKKLLNFPLSVQNKFKSRRFRRNKNIPWRNKHPAAKIPLTLPHLLFNLNITFIFETISRLEAALH